MACADGPGDALMGIRWIVSAALVLVVVPTSIRRRVTISRALFTIWGVPDLGLLLSCVYACGSSPLRWGFLLLTSRAYAPGQHFLTKLSLTVACGDMLH